MGDTMANKWRITAGLVLLVLGLWLTSPVWGARHLAYGQTAATDGVAVTESLVTYSFAQQATFTVQATSDAGEITQVYLFFRATGDERTETVDVPIEPGREVKAEYTHDLRLSPLPPFATVTFWWQLDAAGQRATSEPQQFQYADNRFQWEQLSAGEVTVHWIAGHGDPVFGQAALDIAQASLVRIGEELRAPMPESTDIYIYDSQSNLKAAMMLTGRTWVTGQAHPELGVILIAIPDEEGYLSDMRRYIPHEITHLLVYQVVTPNRYRYVPEWLDEGLATANEQLPTPEYAVELERARIERQLLPLENLCLPFSPDGRDAFLSYAQSYSLVKYIREQYGAPAIRDLLAAYSEEATCAGGVQVALDISFGSLETAWRASLEPQAPWRVLAGQIGIWVGLWLLSLLVALPMIGGLRRRRQQ